MNKYKHDKKWSKIRRRYIKQFNWCEICLAHLKLVKATEVHLITPLSRGGTHERANLMSLCHECHQRIHEEDRKEHGNDRSD